MPKGIDKPYFDKNGVIWLKCGVDERRINSKEELRRFFQFADQFHADELPTQAGLAILDNERLATFSTPRWYSSADMGATSTCSFTHLSCLDVATQQMRIRRDYFPSPASGLSEDSSSSRNSEA